MDTDVFPVRVVQVQTQNAETATARIEKQKVFLIITPRNKHWKTITGWTWGAKGTMTNKETKELKEHDRLNTRGIKAQLEWAGNWNKWLGNKTCKTKGPDTPSWQPGTGGNEGRQWRRPTSSLSWPKISTRTYHRDYSRRPSTMYVMRIKQMK